MTRRIPYPLCLMRAARCCYVSESAAIARQSPKYLRRYGRHDEAKAEYQPDAEFARIVRGTRQ